MKMTRAESIYLSLHNRSCDLDLARTIASYLKDLGANDKCELIGLCIVGSIAGTDLSKELRKLTLVEKK